MSLVLAAEDCSYAGDDEDDREHERCGLAGSVGAAVIRVASGDLDDEYGCAPDCQDGSKDSVPHSRAYRLRAVSV